MSEFDKWFKSLNKNGRVMHFFGNERSVSEGAWNHQQKKIDAVLKYLDGFNEKDIEHETLVLSIIDEIQELLK